MKQVHNKEEIRRCSNYQYLIINMVKKIKSEKFLKRILISLSDYLKENPE